MIRANQMVNALTVAEDVPGLDWWEPWSWEATSAVVVLMKAMLARRIWVKSSIGTTRSLSKVRCGWSCMQSKHWTTDSCTSSTPSVGIPVSGSISRIAS